MADEVTKAEKDAVAMVEKPQETWALETTALPLSMVLVQVFTTAMLLLSKLALNTGMQPFVLIVYRNLIAAAAVAPLGLIFEREMLKKLNLVVWGWLSVNATFGVVLAMGLYYYGLRATSPAYSVNFLNLIPIVTFMIAIVLRAEKLALRKWTGRMKLLGTGMCVGGTMIVTLLKGHLLQLWPAHLLKYSHAQPAPTSATNAHHDMVAGTMFLCGSCLSYALWFNVQSSFQLVSSDELMYDVGTPMEMFPLVAKSFENKQGVFNTGVTFVLISWAISKRGPIYTPMFNSLSLIMTTVMDSLLLGTNIYAGSVLGTLLIILGLYAFLWGKGKELQQAVAAAIAHKQAGHQHESQQRRQGGDDMACLA
ncbi:hypothetical protein EJB05_33253 [Eragrostis curvula]|uniref:WAT1-related protein n=1 Tax=Eragrostis curvula TaxID=38414 RepID=A0A5J9U0U7_9POAL|nr:hypothetical protein EJB05_33253 [Eragrostis curvula]